MSPALALAPLTLAAVLVLSGLAKRPDPSSTHSMMRLLRLPAPVATMPTARALPWGEIGTAALLLTPWRWTYALGALAALGLFLTFWVVIARAMTFDPRPTCGCFGRVGDHRINGRTVTRNTVLVGLALIAGWIALQGRSATGLLADFSTDDWLWLALAVALAAVTFLVLGGAPTGQRPARAGRRARQDQATPSSQEETAELEYVRTPIPRGVLVDRDHQTVSLHALARQQAQLVVLANCWCGSTVAAIDRLPAWRDRLPQLGVQLVHTLRPFDEPRLATTTGVWWDPGATVYETLRAGASPAAVLLGADGLLAGGPVNGVEQIEEFVADIAAELAPTGPEPPAETGAAHPQT
ncbi:MauE/DoxX family redox-associated membrane protein [Ornithinimicrobium flavum]|uniref:MauE/DoxX family redox-associated membrane protein n=1 Tax=Ornithinimicrobium flavum TaxID=1288636 RepID=UPI00106FDFCB|nr:MauE/DoxX family redox-associated membrane protein [Ornithinimicrobium flavum]